MKTKAQIQREHKWLKPIAEELKAEFGGYSKLKAAHVFYDCENPPNPWATQPQMISWQEIE